MKFLFIMKKLFWFQNFIINFLSFILKNSLIFLFWSVSSSKEFECDRIMSMVKNVSLNIRSIDVHQFNIIYKKLVWSKMITFKLISIVNNHSLIHGLTLHHHLLISKGTNYQCRQRKKITKRNDQCQQRLKFSSQVFLTWVNSTQKLSMVPINSNQDIWIYFQNYQTLTKE